MAFLLYLLLLLLLGPSCCLYRCLVLEVLNFQIDDDDDRNLDDDVDDTTDHDYNLLYLLLVLLLLDSGCCLYWHDIDDDLDINGDVEDTRDCVIFSISTTNLVTGGIISTVLAAAAVGLTQLDDDILEIFDRFRY